MHNSRKKRSLQRPPHSHGGDGMLAATLLLVVPCCLGAGGQGVGGVMDMQCTDFTAIPGSDPPFVPKSGQPAVWSVNDGVKFEFSATCGLSFVNKVKSQYNSLMWNATVSKGQGYQMTLIFNDAALLTAVNTRQMLKAGIRVWALEVSRNLTYISSVFNLVGESCSYDTYGYYTPLEDVHGQGTRGPQDCQIIPSTYCPGGFTQDKELPMEMTVYVTPEGYITNSVTLRNGKQLNQTYDFTSVVKGRPPTQVGIEVMQVVDIAFTSISASFWKPEATPDTSKPLPTCDYDAEAKGLATKYFIALGAAVALVTLHIVFAYRLVRRNYWHDNKPHVLSLLCTGIAGLDAFGDIAQVCFFYMAYDHAHRLELPVAKKLSVYFLTSLVLVLCGIVYNAVMLLYVIGISGHCMNQKLLFKYRVFFALQAALTVTNLELLPLFPWRYEAFHDIDSEDIKDLEGFPSTRLMTMSVLPIVFVDLPMIVLQALTQSLDNDYGQILLVCMQVLSALDVICRFFTRAFITASEVESRRKERSKTKDSLTTMASVNSLSSSGGVCTVGESISPITTVEVTDLDHVEFGQRPASAAHTFAINDTVELAGRSATP